MTSALTYISDMLSIYQPTRSLRSSMDLQLTVPKSRLKFWCDRSFPKAAAVEWNALPRAIKKAPSLAVFKKCIKTYLFKCVYE